MKGSVSLLLIAVALVYKANALPYSSTLQKDGYHYKEGNSDKLSELNQESLPFEATTNFDFNQVQQQNLNTNIDEESAKLSDPEEEGYYYEKKESSNPFLNNQESGCTSTSCVATATFGLKKGNANMHAKDQRNSISNPGNPFFNQASAVASVGINSHLPKTPTFPSAQPTRPVSVNIEKNNPFLKPGSGSVILTPLVVETDQISEFPDQFANEPDSSKFPNSPDQFSQQPFEANNGFTVSCKNQNKICVSKQHCVNGYTTQQEFNDQEQDCDLNHQVCCHLKIQENEIKTSQPIPNKGNKVNSNKGGLFDLDFHNSQGKQYPSETNEYLPAIGGEPSDHIPAFSKLPEEPEHEGEANDASPVQIRPTFEPAPEIPPQVGCAAALLCVEEQFCTKDAVISPEPVALSSEQILRRAPMTSCRNPETGITGKCCRDPNYVDPWPTGNLPANYSGGFDEMGFPTFLNIAKTRPKGNRPQESKNNQQTIRPQQPIRSQQPIKTQPIHLVAPLTPKPVQPIKSFAPNSIPSQQVSRQPIKTQPIHSQVPFVSEPIHLQLPFIPEPNRPQQAVKTQSVQHQVPLVPLPIQPIIEEPIHPVQSFSSEHLHLQQPVVNQQPLHPTSHPIIRPQAPIQQASTPQQTVHIQHPVHQQTLEREEPHQVLELEPPFHSEQPTNNQDIIHHPSEPFAPAQSQSPIKTYSPVKGHLPVKSNTPTKSATPSKTFNFPNPPSSPSTTNGFINNFSNQPSVPNLSNPFIQNHHSKNTFETQSTHEKPVVIKPHTPGLQCGLKNQIQRPSSLSDVDVAFGEIPWQAMILSGRDRKLLCSGAIVSPTVILTAAHCVDGFKSSDISIKAGEWKLGYDLKHEEPLDFEIVQVATIVPHPGYSSGKPSYDTALLFLEHPIALDQHVDTICLGDRPAVTADRNCIATGWGKIVLQVNVAGALMHSVGVDLLSENECRQRLEGAEGPLDFDDSLVCGKAHHVNNNMCQVDVGGPLACDRGDGHYELTGVYSQDTGCLPTNQVATFALIDTQWVKEMMQAPPLEKVEHTFSELPSTNYPKPIVPLVPGPEPFLTQTVEPLRESFTYKPQSFQPVKQPIQPVRPILPQVGKPFAKYGPPIAQPNQPLRRPVTPVAPIAAPVQPVAPISGPSVLPQSEISPPVFVQSPSGFQHTHKSDEICDCRQSNLPSALNQYLPPTL
ncbi:uncharacterized protein LOC122512124 isoform X2 [Leptopilina heterotoma]|nr:uncharacterized protein LOC122512124 isoform X2 [Leptopilina heterotoma]